MHKFTARRTRLLGVKRAVTLLLLGMCLSASLPFTPISLALAESYGKVTATELFIREQPSTESDKLRTVKKGAKLTILDTDGDWYKVRFGKITGYAAKQYVSVSGSSSGSSAAKSGASGSVASLGAAPKPSKLGDNNKHVEKLQRALTILGYYDGKISGNFGELTEKAVKAFQKAKGLSDDGVAGSATIKAIFGKVSEEAKIKTEKLNWYDQGQHAIPKDAVFIIKDVRTGKTFKARRWSGADHIDAEPLNAAATKTMKAVYGGSWSWRRRPVLLSYNGHVYAASMNGMPHGNSTIKDNNFDGVFCIHFYKSKTHGSDKVDPAHQACVSEAAKATW